MTSDLPSATVLFHDADGCLNALDGSALPFERGVLSAVDVDGLGNLGHQIDASPLKHLVVNTGRSWEATKFLCEAIASRKLRYALVEHGAELWDLQTNQQIDLSALAERSGNERATRAIADCKNINALIAWFEATGSHELQKRLALNTPLNAQLDKSSNLTFMVPPAIDTAHAVGVLQELIAAEAAFRTDTLVFHHSSWNGFVDVMGSMDKGIGVSLVLAQLGVNAQRSAAIGDGLNDMPMLETVGLPMCPANAVNGVREFCRQRGYVSSSNYIGGTLDWLNTSNTQQASSSGQETNPVSTNLTIIKSFIEAWSRLDADELVEFFTADGVYHNMPAQPVAGHDNLRAFIGGFVSPWTRTDWELLNLAEAGDVVFAERLDKTQAGDKQVDLPCCGVFEMRDGKIAVWRDYFDMQTYIKAMS